MPPSRALVWVDGALFDDTGLPDDVSVRVAVSLGISPVSVVVDGSLLADHAALLVDGAQRLGYTGALADAVHRTLDALGSGTHAVAVLPGPSVRTAAPPGPQWRIEVWPIDPVDPPQVRSAAVSPFPRNHRSGVADLLLVHDAELAFGHRFAVGNGADAALWTNLDGEVCCVDQGALFLALGDEVVTPSVESGCIDSAWRRAVVAAGGVVERRVGLDELRSATSLAVVDPRGSVAAVAVLGEHTTGDVSVAEALRRLLPTSPGALST